MHRASLVRVLDHLGFSHPSRYHGLMLTALFIGVDRHVDARIRELTGARRDATALAAIFADSIPTAKVSLLVDSAASYATASMQLVQMPAAATPDDTLVIAFSGHGTRDQRLVCHDTSLDNLHATSLSMEDLARSFRTSRARAVLFVLDCCFSGGAPARVLDDSPNPRDPVGTLDVFAGTGRLLLAACNSAEVAYEAPARRHGLLTFALLEALTSDDRQHSLPACLDDVMSRVRAEASRMGVTQTPVLFGYVEGGLTLPALRRGANFHAAFPESRGISVTGAIRELSAFGIPDPVLTEWEHRFSNGLNDLQSSAVNDFRLLDGEHLLVVAPTSSGKTFLGEIAALRAQASGKKAVFALPYRALVNEKYDDFLALYGRTLGLRVIRCTGDYVDQVRAFVTGRYDIAVLTYEMLLSLTAHHRATLNHLGLVVLDEAQFITDPTRGIVVELLLTRLLTSRALGVAPQLLVLSATIGDVNSFDEWLGCRCLITRTRPVPLVESVLDRTGTLQALSPGGVETTGPLLPAGDIVQRKDAPSAQDMIVPLVRKLVADGEKVLLFRNRRGAAQGSASYLAKELHLPAGAEIAAVLPTDDLSSTAHTLRECLLSGVAFHTSNLTRDERVTIERAFRDQDSPLRVLVATTTLAAGINTPASTVVLVETEFVGSSSRPFLVAEYKNMVGRAGRLGYTDAGKSILLADNALERLRLFRTYVRGQPEPVTSSFSIDDIDTWLIRVLAQVTEVPRQEASALLANTYGGFLANRSGAGARDRLVADVNSLVARMLSLQLLEDNAGIIRLTLLGRACGSSSLSFHSSLRLVDVVRRLDADHVSPETLVGLIQALAELDACYTPIMRNGRKDAVWAAQATESYGAAVVQSLQDGASSAQGYQARCKRACILAQWTRGTSVEEIERVFTITPFQPVGYGDIRSIADATRFHLRSVFDIAQLIHPTLAVMADRAENLLRQLEIGLPADALGLLDIGAPLRRGEYLALWREGLTSADLIAQADDALLVAAVGATRTKELRDLLAR